MQQKTTEGLAWLDRIEIGAPDGSEFEEILDVLSHGMRDRPFIVAVFGDAADLVTERGL